MMEEYAIVATLENGMTSVFSKRGVIDSSPFEKAHRLVRDSNDRDGPSGYTPDGGMYGRIALLGDKAIKVVRLQAVPRSEYVHQIHDTFHRHLNGDRLKKNS